MRLETTQYNSAGMAPQSAIGMQPTLMDMNVTLGSETPQQHVAFQSPEFLEQSQRKARLILDGQPDTNYRIRYLSEHANHGQLMTDKSQGRKFINVLLQNFSSIEPVEIRVSYYTHADDTTSRRPHQLLQIQGTSYLGYKSYRCIKENGHLYAELSGIRIIKLTRSVLQRQYKKSQEEAEEIWKNFHDVPGCFRVDAVSADAFVADPVYTTKILGSPATLRIHRISATTVHTGHELWVLSDKVKKDDIKVILKTEQGVTEECHVIKVHHQYTVICKIPVLKNDDLNAPKTMSLYLRRPSDDAVSETYDVTVIRDSSPKKRKRVSPDMANRDYRNNYGSPVPEQMLTTENATPASDMDDSVLAGTSTGLVVHNQSLPQLHNQPSATLDQGYLAANNVIPSSDQSQSTNFLLNGQTHINVNQSCPQPSPRSTQLQVESCQDQQSHHKQHQRQQQIQPQNQAMPLEHMVQQEDQQMQQQSPATSYTHLLQQQQQHQNKIQQLQDTLLHQQQQQAHQQIVPCQQQQTQYNLQQQQQQQQQQQPLQQQQQQMQQMKTNYTQQMSQQKVSPFQQQQAHALSFQQHQLQQPQVIPCQQQMKQQHQNIAFQQQYQQAQVITSKQEQQQTILSSQHQQGILPQDHNNHHHQQQQVQQQMQQQPTQHFHQEYQGPVMDFLQYHQGPKTIKQQSQCTFCNQHSQSQDSFFHQNHQQQQPMETHSIQHQHLENRQQIQIGQPSPNSNFLAVNTVQQEPSILKPHCFPSKGEKSPEFINFFGSGSPHAQPENTPHLSGQESSQQNQYSEIGDNLKDIIDQLHQDQRPESPQLSAKAWLETPYEFDLPAPKSPKQDKKEEESASEEEDERVNGREQFNEGEPQDETEEEKESSQGTDEEESFQETDEEESFQETDEESESPQYTEEEEDLNDKERNNANRPQEYEMHVKTDVSKISELERNKTKISFSVEEMNAERDTDPVHEVGRHTCRISLSSEEKNAERHAESVHELERHMSRISLNSEETDQADQAINREPWVENGKKSFILKHRSLGVQTELQSTASQPSMKARKLINDPKLKLTCRSEEAYRTDMERRETSIPAADNRQDCKINEEPRKFFKCTVEPEGAYTFDVHPAVGFGSHIEQTKAVYKFRAEPGEVYKFRENPKLFYKFTVGPMELYKFNGEPKEIYKSTDGPHAFTSFNVGPKEVYNFTNKSADDRSENKKGMKSPTEEMIDEGGKITIQRLKGNAEETFNESESGSDDDDAKEVGYEEEESDNEEREKDEEKMATEQNETVYEGERASADEETVNGGRRNEQMTTEERNAVHREEMVNERRETSEEETNGGEATTIRENERHRETVSEEGITTDEEITEEIFNESESGSDDGAKDEDEEVGYEEEESDNEEWEKDEEQIASAQNETVYEGERAIADEETVKGGTDNKQMTTEERNAVHEEETVNEQIETSEETNRETTIRENERHRKTVSEEEITTDDEITEEETSEDETAYGHDSPDSYLQLQRRNGQTNGDPLSIAHGTEDGDSSVCGTDMDDSGIALQTESTEITNHESKGTQGMEHCKKSVTFASYSEEEERTQSDKALKAEQDLPDKEKHPTDRMEYQMDKAEVLIEQVDHLIEREDDLTESEDDLTESEDDLTEGGNDLSDQEEDLSGEEEDDATNGEEDMVDEEDDLSYTRWCIVQ